jgi:alpha-glucosidase (family GH31 glycosyl hydrolase)
MDFWWIDGWIKPPFGSMDSQLWANRQYFELAEERTGKRGMILSRWGGVGSHRFPVQFSGDTPSDWRTLRHQVEFTARSGNLGAAYWSHDIGGFFDKKVDEELYIRWSQFGAMSPIFRTHSSFGVREPWHYSGRAKRLFRKQTHIRYALAPYFYTLAYEAHRTGLPLIRPLYLEYNNEGDGGARERRHQYTIGQDVLVIPADGPVEKNTGHYRKRAYFPHASWYALETAEVIYGIDDRWISIPLEIIPTYVRGGAILPSQVVGSTLGHRTPEEIHFDYFPDVHAPSVFTLYEDDGESKDYEKGRYALTRLRGRKSTRSIELRVSAPRGTYKGMPRRRAYVLACRLDQGEAVERVDVKVGPAPWTTVKHRVTKDCLAGTVRSGHRFCRVRVPVRNEAVHAKFILA